MSERNDVNSHVKNSDIFNFIERDCCPTCGNPDFKNLFEQKFSNGETKDFIDTYYNTEFRKRLGNNIYKLVECSNCSLIYQKFILDGPGLQFLYELAISPVSSLAKRETAGAKYFNHLLTDSYTPIGIFPNRKPREIKVLDFGMGWGHWAIAGVANGLNVVGAELSESRIQFAKSKGIRILNSLEDKKVKFDYINTDQVFEHLDNPSDILLKLVSKLNSRGVIKIFVPNSTSDKRKLLRGKWSPSKDSFHPLEHINSFTRTSLNFFTKQHGLIPLHDTDVHHDLVFNVKKVIKRRFFGAPSWYFRKT